MILVCTEPSCGTHFKPLTKHMRYIKGDLCRCPVCYKPVMINLNVIPEQEAEIIYNGREK